MDQKGNSHPYELVYKGMLDESVVDFEKTIYYTGSVLSGRNYVRFASAEEKAEFSKKNFGLRYEELHLNDRFDQTLDFFDTPNGEMVISGRLREKLAEAGFTGLIVIPCSQATDGNPVLIGPHYP